MKTAIYIEDGRTQLVLTPETATDKSVLDTLGKTAALKTFRGSFYDCQGGWTRHGGTSGTENSLIFVVDSPLPPVGGTP